MRSMSKMLCDVKEECEKVTPSNIVSLNEFMSFCVILCQIVGEESLFRKIVAAVKIYSLVYGI